jgi:predicted CXXCH cytochrome family protein
MSVDSLVGPHNDLMKLALCLFLLVGSSFASNHPAITAQNANCASCHSDMTKGQSVHSQGELACSLCHSARPDGDKAEMELSEPKAQLCFACHERLAMQTHVSSAPKKECLDCHDAHRSGRAMLLRRDVKSDYLQTSPASSETSHANHKPANAKPRASDKHRGSLHAQSTDHQL